MIRPLLFLALILATPLGAQTSQLRALDTAYSAASWKAVGRLDFGTGAFCTGTLIASDLVLTAAHCLFKPGSAQKWPAGQIRFHAGLRNGSAAASRAAVAAEAHAGFDPTGPLTPINVSHDVALIKLAEPISTFEVAPFYLSSDAAASGTVSVVSYGRGRADAQSRQNQCQLEARQGDLMIFDCDVTFGSSGSPVFSHRNGRGQIVSVVSGMLEYRGQKRSFGMVLPQRVTEVKRQMHMQVPTPTAQLRRITVGGADRGGIGAKFVRP